MKTRQLQWTKKAREDLADAYSYTFQYSPQIALELYDTIIESVDSLSVFPSSGRPGRVPGTRELVIRGTRYIAAYRVKGNPELVLILRVLHDSRQWPDAMK